MKFHPVVSIILGIIVSFMIFVKISLSFSTSILILVAILFATLILGGFIATYLTKDRKMKYGVYEGITLAVFIIILLEIAHSTELNIISVVSALVLCPVISGIGGFIGEIADENNRQSFKKHLHDEFNPILAIISGIIITFLCIALLSKIGDLIDPTSGNVTMATVGIAFLIGGFLTTFFAKKVKYGIYEGISCIILLIIAISYMEMIMGINLYENNYYIFIGMLVGFFLFVIAGSYLGITIYRHFKLSKISL